MAVPIKSGHLQKQGHGVFWRGWHAKHCVLFSDGDFAVYPDDTSKVPDVKIRLKKGLKSIEVGFAAGGDINLPKNFSDMEALFVLKTTGGSHYFLAQSEAERREWVGALEQARLSEPLPRSFAAPTAPIAPTAPPYATAPNAHPGAFGGLGYVSYPEPPPPYHR